MTNGPALETRARHFVSLIAKGDPMTVTRPPVKTPASAIAALDVTDLADAAEAGQDPFFPFLAAFLEDAERPLSDFAGFLPPDAYSAAEAFMAATGSAAVLEASR